MPYTPNSDWRTSKGNVAPDAHWSGADDAYNAREQLKREVESGFSGAVVVRDATRTYNCHAYVHAQRHAWFNDITRFIEDDYYPFTPGTLQVNDAVVYVKNNQITHSGSVIGLSGNQITRVRSKWGAYPEVEHPPGSVPSDYGSIVYYLRRRAKNMRDANEPDESELRDKVQDLLYQLTSSDRMRQLWLASTPEVAEKIVQGFPELTELQLYGTLAANAVAENLKAVDDERVIPLLVAVKRLNVQSMVPVLAEKVSQIKDKAAFSVTDYFLLSTLDALAVNTDYSSGAARKRLMETSRGILERAAKQKKE